LTAATTDRSRDIRVRSFHFAGAARWRARKIDQTGGQIAGIVGQGASQRGVTCAAPSCAFADPTMLWARLLRRYRQYRSGQGI